MAAPSSTQWGSVRGSGNKQGRIGINVTYSDTATARTITIAIWYWTRYRVQDSGNTFKYGWGTSANTTIGSKNINTTSNSSWSTSNQIHIGTYSKTFTKGTSSSTQNASASFQDVDYGGGGGSVTVSFSIPALASYKITYNANGGTGAPGTQTKWYGKNINISSSKPSRTGYTFQGWATSVSGSVSYNPGVAYSGNANLTLYAVWKANTFTVSYNANGGTGAPGNQTKTYGVNLTLSSTKPTRTNYNFLGWGTSAGSTTVSYAAGATYTANAAITLYAIWELAYTAPRITDFVVARCDSSGTVSETGTYAKVTFKWATDRSVSSIKINYKQSTVSTWTLGANVSASGTTNSVSQIIGGGALNTEYAYNIQVVVTDSGGSSDQTRTVGPITFTLDLLKGGKGAAFGKPASLQNTLEIGFKTRFSGGIDAIFIELGTDLNTITTPGVYYGNTGNYINVPSLRVNSSFVLEVLSAGSQGQLIQQLTRCAKGGENVIIRTYYESAWGDWVVLSRPGRRVLWSGVYYMTAGHTATLSEGIVNQEHGVVLVFSYYTGSAASDSEFAYFFIPKEMVYRHTGAGVSCNLSGHWRNGMKYLYVDYEELRGHEFNGQVRTVGGVTYNNNSFVLRYVIGV